MRFGIALCALATACTEPGQQRQTNGDADASPSCSTAADPISGITVAVFFSCDGASPGALTPVLRAAPDSAARQRVAMESLLAGPTPDEQERGYRSFFSDSTRNALIDVRQSAGRDTVWLDFRNFTAALPDVAGVKSFLPPGVMAEMTWTIFRSFPEVEAIHFSFDGSEAAFWQWLGGEPEAFTRRDWEQI